MNRQTSSEKVMEALIGTCRSRNNKEMRRIMLLCCNLQDVEKWNLDYHLIILLTIPSYKRLRSKTTWIIFNPKKKYIKGSISNAFKDFFQ